MLRNTRISALLLLIVLAASVLTGCNSSDKHITNSPNSNVPKDPGWVTVVANQATTLQLGGGADLIIPPGAMTTGAKVHATYQGRPDGEWLDISPVSAPVELISDPPNAIHGLLTLEFPVPVDKLKPGVDPAVEFGVSTYNPSTNRWTPFVSSYDAARHMVVALIPHFSWWNPFTWDFDALYATIAQGFGQVIGTRAEQASCSGAPPGWVGSIAGITNSADVAIRSCTQAQENILDVEMVNNRPYGQVLTYGSSVKWGWQEPATSMLDASRNSFMDANMTPNELYLPPLSRASVGIFEPSAGSNTIFYIGPTKLSIGADLVFYLLGQAISATPDFGKCYGFEVEAPLSDISVSGLRDDLLAVTDCLEQLFPAMVASGALNSVSVGKLSAIFSGIEAASLVGAGIEIGSSTWRIADLVADWIVSRGSTLGNGFSVYTKAAPPPTSVPTTPPAPPTPTQPSTPPTPTQPSAPPTPTQPSAPPTPTPQPQPVTAYSNYGPANAGHAMCRGNPNAPISMPGGTASQTFTVPTGVASLNGALVQIDPDSSVTAHLSIAVNGNVVATATAIAAGDTRFQFGPINVNAGDTITLTISFTSTFGTIITVYTAGSPVGTFTASNSCPDGAPSVSTTGTGLRAVVSGMS